MKNLTKDLPRGSYRVAEGASVLQEGNNAESDHAHVRKVTPLQTKAKQMETAPDINVEREARTTRLRRAKDVRPL
jgi:hypothetical protein